MRIELPLKRIVRHSLLAAITFVNGLISWPAHSEISPPGGGIGGEFICFRSELSGHKYMYFSIDDGRVFGHSALLEGVYRAKITDLSRFGVLDLSTEGHSTEPEAFYAEMVNNNLELKDGSWRLKDWSKVERDVISSYSLARFDFSTNCVLARDDHRRRLR